MDLHAPFQAQIHAEADPRLAQGIYADWLEEQGDPRATLLRLGIEIRSLPMWPTTHRDFALVERYHQCDRALPDYLTASRFMWNVAARMPNVRPIGRHYWFWWESLERGNDWAWVQVDSRHVAYVDYESLQRQATEQLPEFTDITTRMHPLPVYRMEASDLKRFAPRYPFCFDPFLPLD